MTTLKVYLNSQSVTLYTAERPMCRENRVRYKSRKDTIFILFIEKERKQRFPYVVYCFTASRNDDKQRVPSAKSVTNRELWYTLAGVQ
jgi:hypothetical protein